MLSTRTDHADVRIELIIKVHQHILIDRCEGEPICIVLLVPARDMLASKPTKTFLIRARVRGLPDQHNRRKNLRTILREQREGRGQPLTGYVESDFNFKQPFHTLCTAGRRNGPAFTDPFRVILLQGDYPRSQPYAARRKADFNFKQPFHTLCTESSMSINTVLNTEQEIHERNRYRIYGRFF